MDVNLIEAVVLANQWSGECVANAIERGFVYNDLVKDKPVGLGMLILRSIDNQYEGAMPGFGDCLVSEVDNIFDGGVLDSPKVGLRIIIYANASAIKICGYFTVPGGNVLDEFVLVHRIKFSPEQIPPDHFTC